MAESKAPPNRLNISYESKINGGENVRLPLRMMVLGEFNPNPANPNEPLGERRKWKVTKTNLNQVMAEMGTSLEVTVDDKLHNDPEAKLKVRIQPGSLDDFSPDAIIEHNPQLRALRDQRDEIKRLAGELTRDPAARKSLLAVLRDPEKARALRDQLAGGAGGDAGEGTDANPQATA